MAKNYNRGELYSSYDTTRKIDFVKYGEVRTIDDPQGLGRIKVRIKGPQNTGGDDGILDADLPWAFPMIPKNFSSQPKVGEAVFIFIFSSDRPNADRLYIGPIVSQSQKLDYDPYNYTALRGFTFGVQTPDINVNEIPQLNGVFPKPEDVSIQGRYNTDIIQKNNEVVIRAGKFETNRPNEKNPFSFKFNANTQGYIQIKNNVVTQQRTTTTEQLNGTITNIVSNKINLITHEGGNPRFNVLDQDYLITNDEQMKILNEAHQLPFGDVLLEYLILLKEALFSHVHNGNGNVATDLTASGNKQSLAIFKSKADQLEKSMLSKNIRIN